MKLNPVYTSTLQEAYGGRRKWQGYGTERIAKNLLFKVGEVAIVALAAGLLATAFATGAPFTVAALAGGSILAKFAARELCYKMRVSKHSNPGGHSYLHGH